MRLHHDIMTFFSSSLGALAFFSLFFLMLRVTRKNATPATGHREGSAPRPRPPDHHHRGGAGLPQNNRTPARMPMVAPIPM